MASKKQKGWKWKDVGISVDSKVIKKLPKNPKNMDGMKKGSGQLPSGFTTGVSGGGTPAAESLSLLTSLLHLKEAAAAIEDITDQQPVTSSSAPEGGQEGAPAEQPAEAGPSDEPVPVDGAAPVEDGGGDRYVKGAHLISKTQVDAADFEELWIYRIDPNAPEESGKVLKNILAGTDIPENKSRSDDGKQSYTLWTAGNAQYIHITGLSN